MVAAITPRYKPEAVSLSIGRPLPARRSSLLSPIHRKGGASLSARLPLVEQAASKTLNRVRQPRSPNLSSRTVTILSFTDLSASLSRHILEMVPSVGPNHLSVAGLDCVSSGIGLFVGGAVTVGSGVLDLNRSNAIGDGEGMRRAATQVVSGAISTNASALSLAYQAAAATFAGLGVAADVCLGIGSVINMSISGLSIYRSACFLSRIEGHLYRAPSSFVNFGAHLLASSALLALANFLSWLRVSATLLEAKICGQNSQNLTTRGIERNNLSEKERVVKTLEFLKEKIGPTANEKEAIAKEVEKLYPNQNLEEKIALVKRKILDLAEVKFRYVKRRTGQKTAERILMDVDKHLQQLRDPKSDGFHLASAKELIRLVQKQTKKEMLIASLVAVTSLIAFTALILGTFFSLGVLPFALYAISSAIALCILLYPLIVENLNQSKAAAIKKRAVALTHFTVATTGYR